MRKILSIAICLVFLSAVHAQVKDPDHWSFTSKKLNATTYEVDLTAAIDAGWHIYSQTTPDGGPVPTSIYYSANRLLVLDGKTKEV